MTVNSNLPINALLILASLFYSGTVLPDTFKDGGDAYKQRDYATAVAKFKEVAAKGDHRAMYALGSMYAGGTGVKQNYRQAARYYRDVGQKGYAHGQFKLGQLYLQGKGVQLDLVRAYAWMFVARQNFQNSMPKTDSAGTNSETRLAVDEFQSGDIFATIHLKLINAELDDIKAQLTAAQLQEAQKLVGEFSQYR